MLSLRLARPVLDISGTPLRHTRSAYDISGAAHPPLRLTRSAYAIGTSIILKPRPILPNITKLVDNITRAKAKLKEARLALAQYSLIENSASSRAREAYIQAEREVEETCKAWCQAQRK